VHPEQAVIVTGKRRSPPGGRRRAGRAQGGRELLGALRTRRART
jgi:hypothetical protein